MKEELIKRLYGLVDSADKINQEVPVKKFDLINTCTEIVQLERKIKELESQNRHLSRQLHVILEENDQLAQDFYYIVQQINGLPTNKNGMKVRLPEYFLEKMTDDIGGVFGQIYYVLRPEHDPAAKAALHAYAETTENKLIAHKILLWLGEHTAADKPEMPSVVDVIAESLMRREERLKNN